MDHHAAWIRRGKSWEYFLLWDEFLAKEGFLSEACVWPESSVFALAWIRAGAVFEGPSGSIASAKSELLSEPVLYSSGTMKGHYL